MIDLLPLFYFIGGLYMWTVVVDKLGQDELNSNHQIAVGIFCIIIIFTWPVWVLRFTWLRIKKWLTF